MLLKVYNRALINDREKTYLTSAASASDTSLTVADTDLAPAATSSNTWSDNDYMIVGEIGQEKTEVMQMSAAVTSATSLSIDREGQAGGLRHDHPVGTPVYRIDYNQVQFLHNSTDTTTGASALTTISIQPDEEYTRYEDTSNSTGYGFGRFYNATSTAYSSYSDGVNYTESGDASSRDPRTQWAMRNKVRLLLDEKEADSKLTDEMIDEALNDKQREIAHIRLWTFFESERSQVAVANKFAYDIPDNVQKVHTVKWDTQPLIWMTKADWDRRHFDTDQSTADPSHVMIWNRQMNIYPRPSSAGSTTTLGADLSATATTATVADSSGWHRGDYYRLKINDEIIYATNSTSTTFTGLLRGREGTTAAAHSSGDTVTELDLVYSCHVEPDDLIDTQDRTSIPEPEILTYGTAIDLAPFVGKEDFIEFWQGLYDKRIKELKEKYSSKQSSQHGRIKDVSERVRDVAYYQDPNRFPRDVNT